MRRAFSLIIAFILSLGPVAPLFAGSDPVNPLTQDPNPGGDLVSLEQMQQGQQQDQQQLQNQTFFLNQPPGPPTEPPGPPNSKGVLPGGNGPRRWLPPGLVNTSVGTSNSKGVLPGGKGPRRWWGH